MGFLDFCFKASERKKVAQPSPPRPKQHQQQQQQQRIVVTPKTNTAPSRHHAADPQVSNQPSAKPVPKSNVTPTSPSTTKPLSQKHVQKDHSPAATKTSPSNFVTPAVTSPPAAEDNRTEHDAYKQICDKHRAKISEHARLRDEHFKASREAYGMKKGQEAKQLSEQGKQEGELMEKAKRDMAIEVFEYLNKGLPQTTIDLHGQYVDAALTYLRTFINRHRNQGTAEVLVITGAGNHSGAEGPLIKPKSVELFRELKLSYEEQANKGSFIVRF